MKLFAKSPIAIMISARVFPPFFSATIPLFCSSSLAITSLVRNTAFTHAITNTPIRSANTHAKPFPSSPPKISIKNAISSMIVAPLNILRIFR